ncbi:hypothetical protein ACWKWC_00870 [Geodermatophilus nigrescens]
MDADFDTSMSYVQSMLRNISVDHRHPIGVDFVRCGDVDTVGMALTADADVLHVMAHGSSTSAAGPTFSSSDGRVDFSLEQLRQQVAMLSRGVRASVVIADGCRTASPRWLRAFSDVIEGPATYIGTTVDVGWHEITVFGALFYGALFRPDLREGSDPENAADKAGAAYASLLGRRCPYRAHTLEPSS